MQRAGGGQNAAQNPGTPTQPSPNAQPGATAQPGGNPPAAGGQGQAAVVQQNPGAAAPANAAPAGNAQQPATSGQAPSPNASAAASSSASTAQQAASQAGRGPNPGPASAQAPQPMSLGSLFLAPNSLAGQLATALSQAMQGSGLFYESHLRELAFGQRTPEQMRSEPQAQAGREAGNAQQNPSTAAQARGTGEASGNQAGQASTSSQGGQQAAAPQAAATAQASAQLAGALLGMDPSTHALVRQQLEVLANQSFAWQGEAWPGGDLEWEVQRRDPQEGGEDTESWSTQLKLQLPGLGEVHARVSLATHQLVMHLTAPEAAGMIADHTGLLRERLGLHGLQLSQLTISRDAIAEDGTQS